MTPLYSAFMILPPGVAFTKKVPITDARIETPPSTSGYSTPFGPTSVAITTASNIVAMMVTA
jgi:hypothetical protein